jgi:hypothetical protein
MAIALPFILQLLGLAPTLVGAYQTLHSIATSPNVTITDSAGAPLPAQILADLKASVLAATASAVTGVQAAG